MTQTDQEEAASDLRSKRCCRRWMHQFADGYPRTFAIVVDMMLPMLVLGMIATAFGYWLSYLESPNEIINNDQQLQILNQQQYVLETIGNLTALTPRLCFRRYFDNNTEVEYLVNSSLQQAEINKNSTTPVLQQQLEVLVTLNLELQYLLQESEIKPQPPQSLVVVNATELYNYAVECGDRVRAFSNNITSSFSNSGAAYSLTFNWNRCTPIHSSDNQNSYESSLRPAQQEQFYVTTWNADQAMLYETYCNVYRYEQNLSQPDASFMAWNRSVHEATGASGCVANALAGAWFWFTFMQTTGYGNQPIDTQTGRTMVYCFGLFSILLFGGVLISAGSVTTAIFDDALMRFRLKALTLPWVACLFWGSVYYLWMLVIANAYQDWNRVRLGPEGEVTFGDSYWFAYISTTTVGLGDYVLAPEVLQMIDMITWPLRFLAGFIFFAAFVGELSRILQGPAQRHAKKLADRLRQKGMVYGEARVSVAASQSSPARKTGESGYEDAPGRDSRDFALPVVTEQSERILINAKSLANGELFAAESANSDQDVVSLEQRANRTPPSDAL